MAFDTTEDGLKTMRSTHRATLAAVLVVSAALFVPAPVGFALNTLKRMQTASNTRFTPSRYFEDMEHLFASKHPELHAWQRLQALPTFHMLEGDRLSWLPIVPEKPVSDGLWPSLDGQLFPRRLIDALSAADVLRDATLAFVSIDLPDAADLLEQLSTFMNVEKEEAWLHNAFVYAGRSTALELILKTKKGDLDTWEATLGRLFPSSKLHVHYPENPNIAAITFRIPAKEGAAIELPSYGRWLRQKMQAQEPSDEVADAIDHLVHKHGHMPLDAIIKRIEGAETTKITDTNSERGSNRDPVRLVGIDVAYEAAVVVGPILLVLLLSAVAFHMGYLRRIVQHDSKRKTVRDFASVMVQDGHCTGFLALVPLAAGAVPGGLLIHTGATILGWSSLTTTFLLTSFGLAYAAAFLTMWFHRTEMLRVLRHP